MVLPQDFFVVGMITDVAFLGGMQALGESASAAGCSSPFQDHLER